MLTVSVAAVPSARGAVMARQHAGGPAEDGRTEVPPIASVNDRSKASRRPAQAGGRPAPRPRARSDDCAGPLPRAGRGRSRVLPGQPGGRPRGRGSLLRVYLTSPSSWTPGTHQPRRRRRRKPGLWRSTSTGSGPSSPGSRWARPTAPRPAPSSPRPSSGSPRRRRRRRTPRQTRRPAHGPGSKPGKDPRSLAVLEKLDQPVAMSFPNETPLEDVLKYVKQATQGANDAGIPIYVDPLGLTEADRTMTSPVSIDLEGVPFATRRFSSCLTSLASSTSSTTASSASPATIPSRLGTRPFHERAYPLRGETGKGRARRAWRG